MKAVLDACVRVLEAAEPIAKCSAAVAASQISLASAHSEGSFQPVQVPARPARPERPQLVAPGDVRRRKLGSPAGRTALLHALAHIELNAIDLAFDMAARFAPAIKDLGLDARGFVRDWVRIGTEEARHFQALEARLAAYGAVYGDLAAHDGLWSAAERTSGNVLARLAIAPMTLEARGLDVTPTMADRLDDAGDEASARIIRMIFDDEVGHVAAGVNWFEAICIRQDLAPAPTFRALLQTHFAGGLKPPFNDKARKNAGMHLDFYADAK